MPGDLATSVLSFAFLFAALGGYLWRLHRMESRLTRRLDALGGRGDADAMDRSPTDTRPDQEVGP